MITVKTPPKKSVRNKSAAEKFRTEFLSRNSGLINKDLQKKIQATRLLFIGCGLTSQTAVLATRAGFENFILCDGDKVEINNLNRQAFDLSDVGKNKAVVTREKILKVNPMCKVKIFQSFIRQDSKIDKLIKNCDIVINSADPDESIYSINERAQKEKKLVLFPMTFGYGGYLLIFKPKSKKLEEILGDRIMGWRFFAKLIEKTTNPVMSRDVMRRYLKAFKKNRYAPQLGQSVYLVSTMIVESILRWLDNKKMITAPRAIISNPLAEKEGDKFLL